MVIKNYGFKAIAPAKSQFANNNGAISRKLRRTAPSRVKRMTPPGSGWLSRTSTPLVVEAAFSAGGDSTDGNKHSGGLLPLLSQSGLEYLGTMNKLTVELPDETAAQLRRLAERLGTPVESLAAASVVELVTRPDEQFAEIGGKVLAKNRELYRRLA